MPYDRPQKHSLTLRGHRTSVSLESDFWHAFQHVAETESIALNELAARIDADRGIDTGLATAIRLYLFRWYRDRAV